MLTPRNSLDGKLIIDREALQTAFCHTRDAAHELTRLGMHLAPLHEVVARLERALAQDNTGWAAVPVKATKEQCEAEDAAVGIASVTFWAETNPPESFKTLKSKLRYRAMLNASPPLPGGE